MLKRCEIEIGSQGLLLLMELKIFDNDDQATKHLLYIARNVGGHYI